MNNTTGLVLLLSLSVGLTVVGGCNPQPESINVERVAEITSIAILPFEDAPGVHGRNSGKAVSGFVTGGNAKDVHTTGVDLADFKVKFQSGFAIRASIGTLSREMCYF